MLTFPFVQRRSVRRRFATHLATSLTVLTLGVGTLAAADGRSVVAGVVTAGQKPPAASTASPPAPPQQQPPPPPPATAGTPAAGQTRRAAPTPREEFGFDTVTSWKREGESPHWTFTGTVVARRGDMWFFADHVESFTDTHRVVATGNVTYRQADAQISADRMEFNTETRLGVFYNAYGFASLAREPTRSAMGGQEPDVYFTGDRIEKIGVDKYRISRGGFTTCLQPTPRWQITSSSVTLRLDHYALLRHAVIRAKGVPVFYVPALFYPVQKDDRATGFLLPTYGQSTLRGFTLSNAFFWAINRSHDATFMHDWFSRTGHGFGGEYRYASAPGSSGNVRVYRLYEHEVSTTTNDQTTITPGRESLSIRANVNQALGRRWSARGRVDYFTDITVQQTYNTDIYDASRQTRSWSGNIGGTVGGFTVNGTVDRNEYFQGSTDSTVAGGAPRLQFARGERPLFGTPLYVSLNGEYARLVRETHSGTTFTERNLTRLDIQPTIRFPFTKLRFLTVSSSMAWRGTYWTRSRTANKEDVLEEPIARTYFDLQSRVTGPMVNRVWNRPNSKWKHAIEPYFNVQHVTSVDNFDQIIQLDGADYILGGTTRIDYGLTNRVMVKRGTAQMASAREVLSVQVSQTYYTDARASQYDLNYSTGFSGQEASNFSPIRMTVRAAVADDVHGSFRLEYDRNKAYIPSIAAEAQVGLREWGHVTVGYSERRLPNLLDQTQAQQRDNFLNLTANLRTPSNRVGGAYSFHYDVGRSSLLTSRIVGYYNAQCCGFAVEYQTFNYPYANTAFTVKQDNRWNFSFTLAGLGTFSNFFGALGGLQR